MWIVYCCGCRSFPHTCMLTLTVHCQEYIINPSLCLLRTLGIVQCRRIFSAGCRQNQIMGTLTPMPRDCSLSRNQMNSIPCPLPIITIDGPQVLHQEIFSVNFDSPMQLPIKYFPLHNNTVFSAYSNAVWLLTLLPFVLVGVSL